MELASEPFMTAALFGKMLMGLFFVLGTLGLLVVILRFLQKKKFSVLGDKQALKIIQTSHLGGKQKLAVISWGQTQYLVGLGPSGGFLIDKKLSPQPKIALKRTDSKTIKVEETGNNV